MSIEVKLTYPKPIKFLTSETRRKAAQAVKATAFAISAHAKDAAPVDTGFLKNSIFVVGDGYGTEAAAAAAAGGKAAREFLEAPPVKDDLEAAVAVGAEYGVDVEMGTLDSRAQPYLAPAVEAEREAFQKRMAEVLKG